MLTNSIMVYYTTPESVCPKPAELAPFLRLAVHQAAAALLPVVRDGSTMRAVRMKGL
jgi:hypothetical protein